MGGRGTWWGRDGPGMPGPYKCCQGSLTVRL